MFQFSLYKGFLLTVSYWLHTADPLDLDVIYGRALTAFILLCFYLLPPSFQHTFYHKHKYTRTHTHAHTHARTHAKDPLWLCKTAAKFCCCTIYSKPKDIPTWLANKTDPNLTFSLQMFLDVIFHIHSKKLWRSVSIFFTHNLERKHWKEKDWRRIITVKAG